MSWLWLLVLELVVCVTPGFAYYHTLSKRDFSVSPIIPEANFGFSISSFSSSSNSRLVVGAPLADDIGKIYTCALAGNEANSCESADRTGISRFKDDSRYNNESYWYGATVKGTENFYVACSPLFIDRVVKFLGGEDIGTYGRCYKSYNKGVPQNLRLLDKKTRRGENPDCPSGQCSKSDTKIVPEKSKLLQNKTTTGNVSRLEDVMDSFGWSLDISSDDYILVGGPAMTTGRVVKVKSNTMMYINGTRGKHSFNFGYSVASGRFLLANKLSIAVGTTYGSDGHGKVSFVDEDHFKIQSKKDLQDHDHVGSMFGAVLCPATLTQRGDVNHKTDLLVGAPTYAGEGYNYGAVFVYIARKLAMGPVFKNKIVGKMDGSYFGSAMVSVGDLNGDGKDEIAIAAPYEHEGRGTVYLYSGAHLVGDNLISPVQTIEPEPSTLRTFGYSLTALRDFDDNGCNELAIGIPAINTVTVYRCLAAITIELLNFESQMPKIDGNKKLPVCLKAEFPAKPVKVKAEILVNIVINHDDATLYDGAVKIKIEKKQNEAYCQDISIFISKDGKYNKQITYVLTASLINHPTKNKDFEGSEVILTERSALQKSGLIWFQECGNKTCVPNLEMVSNYSEKSHVIGSSPSVNATVAVTNTGDVAYDGCVRVTATGAPLQRTDLCQLLKLRDGEVLECKPEQNLHKDNPPWSTGVIPLDTTKLTNQDKTITVNLMLYNECGKNVSDQQSTVIPLHANTNIVVHGRVDDGVDTLVNLTRSDIAVRKTFQHVYTISNRGTTNWMNVNITVKVQNQNFFNSFVSIDEQLFAVLTNDSKTVDYSGELPNLNRDASVEVKLIMKVVPELITERIGKENLTVYSVITVDLDGIEKTTNVTSELRLVEGKTPIWMIIAASILALIILVIIFFILRECGFLERKNKNDLKRVRMSVRRQTIMRQSMMNQPRSQELERLVEAEAQQASSTQEKKKKDRRVVIKDN